MISFCFVCCEILNIGWCPNQRRIRINCATNNFRFKSDFSWGVLIPFSWWVPNMDDFSCVVTVWPKINFNGRPFQTQSVHLPSWSIHNFRRESDCSIRVRVWLIYVWFLGGLFTIAPKPEFLSLQRRVLMCVNKLLIYRLRGQNRGCVPFGL